METIDITPTWSGLLPALLRVLENDEAPVEVRLNIEAELRKMARLADAYVEIVKGSIGVEDVR